MHPIPSKFHTQI